MTRRYISLRTICVCLNMLFFIFVQSLYGQANPDIKLGDSYEVVEAKIEEDISFEFHRVVKKQDKISVYVRPGCGLSENTVVEYYFTKKLLTQSWMIQHVSDPDAMMAFIYKSLIPKYGEPKVVTRERHRAYRWKMEDKYQYCFKAFSNWFNGTCFVVLHEK